MTPSKSNRKLNTSIFLVSMTLFLVSLSNIYLYNRTVNLKHLIVDKEKAVQGLKAANADAKNKLFQFLSSESLNNILKEKEWVKVKNPEYLKISEY